MTSIEGAVGQPPTDGLRHRHHDEEEEKEEENSQTTAKEGSLAAFEDVFFKPNDVEPQITKISSNDQLLPPQGLPERWCACCGFQYDPNKRNLILDISEEDKNIEDMSQILKDVRRTMWNWSYCREDRQTKQAGLCRVLVKAFAQNRGNKHYFQGCNEVASILMFALGEVQAVQALDWLMNHTLTRWFELSLPPLVELMAHVMPLLDIADGEVYQHINSILCGLQPNFALSWLMTWLSHNTDDVQAIYKVFDLLFDIHEGDAISIIYVATQIIVMCRDDVLTRTDDEIHEYFTKLLPPIVTRDRAKIMLDAADGKTELNGYYPPLAKGSVKVIAVEDIIDGAKKLMKETDWDKLKQHKKELEEQALEADSHRVYRANVTRVDNQSDVKIQQQNSCIPTFPVIVGTILVASIAGVWYFASQH